MWHNGVVGKGCAVQVTTEAHAGARVIAVDGDVDLASVSEIQAHVDAALADGDCRLVIDIEHVHFLDSSVLHTLFRTLRRVRRAGGDIAIVCVDPSILRVLEVFGLTGQIRVCTDVRQAVAALAPK
jgi:anti-sigma B factor antagonist